MKRNLLLELLEDGTCVSIYSVRFEDERYSEFEKFLVTYKDDEQFAEDLGVLFARLESIKRDGAIDRHLRYEGKQRDRVKALPSYLDTSRLRLYCISIEGKILILGNGGVKSTATYQEDAFLNRCVETLQKIDFEIKIRENRKTIRVIGTQLEGELSFYINE